MRSGALHGWADHDGQIGLAEEAAQLGFWERDLSTGAGSWSRGMFRVFGRAESEGAPSVTWFRERVHPDDLARYDANWVALRGGRLRRCELRFLRDDGCQRHVIIVAQPVAQPGSEGGRLSGIALDVTDDREREGEVEGLRRRAEQGLRARDAFLAAMGHEMRTPVHGLLGLLTEVERMALPPEASACLALARTSAEQLLASLNAVLALSKEASGSGTPPMSGAGGPGALQATLSQAAATAGGVSGEVALARLAGCVALVADDNAINRRVAQKMLERLDMRVVLAEDGQHALAALGTCVPDVVLMDCHMPLMDGFDAARSIRAGVGGRPDVPVVALTASASDDDRRRCFEAGMNAFLSKPFSTADLLRVLPPLLGDRGRRTGA